MENNERKPDNMMVWSILTTVVCCLPLGIAAILESNKVDSLWASGNHNEAIESAEKAKKYCIIAVGVGVLVWIICIVLSLVMGMLE